MIRIEKNKFKEENLILIKQNLRKCTNCDQIKKLTNFYFYRKRNQYINLCIDCDNERKNRWAHKNQNKIKQARKDWEDKSKGIFIEKPNLNKIKKEDLYKRGLKECTNIKCKKIKPLVEFNKNKNGLYGLSDRCRDCQKIDHKLSESKPDYKKKNNERHNIYRKNKRINDPNYKLYTNLRSRIKNYLRGFTESFETQEILEYSVKDFKDFMINNLDRIQAGYTFDDYHKGFLEIDHIIPISFFPKTIEAMKLANKLENLRLISGEKNNNKSDKIDMILIKKFKLIKLYKQVLKLKNS
jgi:hypothetical protein